MEDYIKHFSPGYGAINDLVCQQEVKYVMKCLQNWENVTDRKQQTQPWYTVFCSFCVTIGSVNQK